MVAGRRRGCGLVILGTLGLAAWRGPWLFAALPSAAGSVRPHGAAANLPQAAGEGASIGAATYTATACPALACGLLAAAVAGLTFSRRRAAAARKQVDNTARAARGGARGGGKAAPLVVIAGPPAAGKGTQCEKIKPEFGYVHISTGDILRENVKNGTELGLKAKGYMDSGALVPSALIVDLVKDRLEKPDVKEKGCLLDGFPRAPDQAQAMMDAGLKVDRFVLIKVPDDTLVERGCGRRLDPETGDIYHLKFKPPPAEILDRLVHRSDDQEDKIRARLNAYHSQIDGILPFFKEAVVEVDGTGKPEEVWSLVQAGLKTM